MDQHLTVKEAIDLTGKSESTIKRLIREVVNEPKHADRSFILPPHDEVERRRKAGEPYIWKIDRQLLLRRFPREDATEEGSRTSAGSAPIDHSTAPVIEVLREQLQSKDRQIQTLETQLDRKDQQIENLNERMRESNILMNELQKRLAITAPQSTSRSEPVEATPTESEEGSRPPAKPKQPSKTKSQSIWTQPIGQLFRRSQ